MKTSQLLSHIKDRRVKLVANLMHTTTIVDLGKPPGLRTAQDDAFIAYQVAEISQQLSVKRQHMTFFTAKDRITFVTISNPVPVSADVLDKGIVEYDGLPESADNWKDLLPPLR